MDDPIHSPKPGAASVGVAPHVVGDVALVGLIVIAVARCVVAFHSAVPWNFSHLLPDAPDTAVEAAGTAIVDALMVGVLLAAMVDAMLRRARLTIAAGSMIGLWMIGALFTWQHAMFSADGLRIGGNWIGATALGLAAMLLAGVPRRRTLLVAAMVALVVPLSLDAAHQVLVEHPMTVRQYEADRAAALAAQGIEVGSAAQRKFETRLNQVEATGQFGLSNVFGSVIGTLTLLAGGVALAAMCRRAVPWWRPAGVVAIALLGVVALMMTLSKGALLAALLAGGAVAVAWRAKPGWLRAVCVGAVVFAFAAVVVRGWIGPPDSPAGERSLLFRWFYWQGAASMLAQDPLWGVGPGRFQEYFLRHKPPLCPEDVSDPHNVFVSWLSMLGVGGAALCGMLGVMFWRAASPPLAASHQADGSTTAPREAIAKPPAAGDVNWRLLVALAAALLAFGAQYVIQLDMLWIDSAAILVLGAVLFVAIAARLPADWLDTPAARLGLIAAATGALVHAQIEMNLVNTMSAPLLFVLLGTAAGRGDAATRERSPARWPWAVLLGVALAACSPLALFVPRLAIAQARMGQAVRALVESPDSSDSYLVVGDILGVSGWFPHEPRGAALYHEAVVAAISRQPLDEQAGLWREVADEWPVLDPPHPASLNPAKQLRRRLLIVRLGWRASGDPFWVEQAARAQAGLERYEPHGLFAFVELGDVFAAMGASQKAVEAYRRALAIDANYYLDPDSRLSDPVRGRIAAYVRRNTAVEPRLRQPVP